MPGAIISRNTAVRFHPRKAQNTNDAADFCLDEFLSLSMI